MNEIKKKCGNVEYLASAGWHFSYNQRHYIYMDGKDADMLRFCVPHLVKTSQYDGDLLSEAINETNRKVKFIKAVLLDCGSVSLNYDHRTTSEDSADIIIPHIINALDFAASFLLEKLQEHEKDNAHNAHAKDTPAESAVLDEDYMKEIQVYHQKADFYTKQALSYEREAEYYSLQAQGLLQNAEHHSGYKNDARSDTYRRRAKTATDKAESYARKAKEAKELALVYTRKAEKLLNGQNNCCCNDYCSPFHKMINE